MAARNEIAVIPEAVDRSAAAQHPESVELAHIQRVGNMFVQSGFFSDSQQVAQAAVKIMAGREVGVPPVASMMGINIIKGKVAMGANLLASRVRFHGYDWRVKRLDAKGCDLMFLGKDVAGKRDELGVSSFDENDAKAAGTNNEQYRKNPRNMYFARAMSNGVKWFTPEVTAGVPVYMAEELGANVDADGEYVESEARESRGTKEAAHAVAERKIAEMKTKAAPEPDKEKILQDKYWDPATTVQPNDEKDNLLDEAKKLLHSVEPAQMSAAISECWQVKGWTKVVALDVPRLRAGVELLKQKLAGETSEPIWTDKFRMMEDFGTEKKRLITEGGTDAGEAAYYAVLGKHGAEKCNEFSTDLDRAAKCYAEMVNCHLTPAE